MTGGFKTLNLACVNKIALTGCAWLFVYPRGHSYKERLHVPLEILRFIRSLPERSKRLQTNGWEKQSVLDQLGWRAQAPHALSVEAELVNPNLFQILFLSSEVILIDIHLS